MFNGYITATVTPFTNGAVDFSNFEKYISYITKSGVSGFVVCGSTGESLSLSMQEKIDLIKTASAVNESKIQLIGGIIDSVTENCVELIRKTEQYVDAFLCICPFYIKPSQQQIYDHFKKLHDSTSRKIILYNNPSRVGTSIEFDTFKKLCDLENIVAIKECASDLSRFSLWKKEIKRKNFNFLTGNDDVACGALAMGADGVISVSANIAPQMCVNMYEAFKRQNIEKFCILRDILAPLHKLLFAEPSPTPVKYVLSTLGLIFNELRDPLSPISPKLQKELSDLIRKKEIN